VATNTGEVFSFDVLGRVKAKLLSGVRGLWISGLGFRVEGLGFRV
jgi:hypothetical protein